MDIALATSLGIFSRLLHVVYLGAADGPNLRQDTRLSTLIPSNTEPMIPKVKRFAVRDTPERASQPKESKRQRKYPAPRCLDRRVCFSLCTWRLLDDPP